jgi:hypothetical protein
MCYIRAYTVKLFKLVIKTGMFVALQLSLQVSLLKVFPRAIITLVSKKFPLGRRLRKEKVRKERIGVKQRKKR